MPSRLPPAAQAIQAPASGAGSPRTIAAVVIATSPAAWLTTSTASSACLRA